MPFIEIDTLSSSLKKYATIGFIGFTAGFIGGYYVCDKVNDTLDEKVEELVKQYSQQN